MTTTPTPWVTDYESAEITMIYGTANGRTVPIVSVHNNAENAELIVKAVNAAFDLRAALEQIANPVMGSYQHMVERAIGIAREALAR